MSWRPKNWENPHKTVYTSLESDYVGNERLKAFEAGADAMYEPAYREGMKDTMDWCKKRHYATDYELDGFIRALKRDKE